jgi:hypothetical protein
MSQELGQRLLDRRHDDFGAQLNVGAEPTRQYLINVRHANEGDQTDRDRNRKNVANQNAPNAGRPAAGSNPPTGQKFVKDTRVDS